MKTMVALFHKYDLQRLMELAQRILSNEITIREGAELYLENLPEEGRPTTTAVYQTLRLKVRKVEPTTLFPEDESDISEIDEEEEFTEIPPPKLKSHQFDSTIFANRRTDTGHTKSQPSNREQDEQICTGSARDYARISSSETVSEEAYLSEVIWSCEMMQQGLVPEIQILQHALASLKGKLRKKLVGRTPIYSIRTPAQFITALRLAIRGRRADTIDALMKQILEYPIENARYRTQEIINTAVDMVARTKEAGITVDELVGAWLITKFGSEDDGGLDAQAIKTALSTKLEKKCRKMEDVVQVITDIHGLHDTPTEEINKIKVNQIERDRRKFDRYRKEWENDYDQKRRNAYRRSSQPDRTRKSQDRDRQYRPQGNYRDNHKDVRQRRNDNYSRRRHDSRGSSHGSRRSERRQEGRRPRNDSVRSIEACTDDDEDIITKAVQNLKVNNIRRAFVHMLRADKVEVQKVEELPTTKGDEDDYSTKSYHKTCIVDRGDDPEITCAPGYYELMKCCGGDYYRFEEVINKIELAKPVKSSTIWCLDGGSTTHAVKSIDAVSSFGRKSAQISSCDDSTLAFTAQTCVTKPMKIRTTCGQQKEIQLDAPVYSKKFSGNFLSESQLLDEGDAVEITKTTTEAIIKWKCGKQSKVYRREGLYFVCLRHEGWEIDGVTRAEKCLTDQEINTIRVNDDEGQKNHTAQSIHTMTRGQSRYEDHLRSGHSTYYPGCEACALHKSGTKGHRKNQAEEKNGRNFDEFSTLQVDTSGPYVEGYAGQKYSVVMVDSGPTMHLSEESVKRKADAPQAIQAIKQRLGHLWQKVKKLVIDRAPELIKIRQGTADNKRVQAHGRSAPPLTGCAEANIKTLDALCSATLHSCGLPKRFWPWCRRYVADTLNNMQRPTQRRLGLGSAMQQLNLKNLSDEDKFAFGQICYVKKATKDKKLEARYEKCIFIGYESCPEPTAYKVIRCEDVSKRNPKVLHVARQAIRKGTALQNIKGEIIPFVEIRQTEQTKKNGVGDVDKHIDNPEGWCQEEAAREGGKPDTTNGGTFRHQNRATTGGILKNPNKPEKDRMDGTKTARIAKLCRDNEETQEYLNPDHIAKIIRRHGGPSRSWTGLLRLMLLWIFAMVVGSQSIIHKTVEAKKLIQVDIVNAAIRTGMATHYDGRIRIRRRRKVRTEALKLLKEICEVCNITDEKAVQKAASGAQNLSGKEVYDLIQGGDEMWRSAVIKEQNAILRSGEWVDRTSTRVKYRIPTFTLHTYKARSGRRKSRSVALGSLQRTTVSDTYAPVASPAILRLGIALYAKLAESENHVVEIQHDAPEAFLQASLQPSQRGLACDIHADKNWLQTIPSEYGDITDFKVPIGKDGLPQVLLLRNSIYGLKTSGRDFADKVQRELCSNGWVQMENDRSVYLHPKKGICLFTYVDDFLSIRLKKPGEKINDEDELFRGIRVKEEHAVNGERDYLGINLKKANGHYELYQSCDAIKKIWNTIEKPNRVVAPIAERLQYPEEKYAASILSKIQLSANKKKRKNSEFNPEEHKYPFRTICGMISYFTSTTRIDNQLATTQYQKLQHASTNSAWVSAVRNLSYLQDTRCTQRIKIEKRPIIRIAGLADADWASEPNGRSTSSHILGIVALTHEEDKKLIRSYNPEKTYQKGADTAQELVRAGVFETILWNTQLQKSIALSTFEAETASLTRLFRNMIIYENALREIISKLKLDIEMKSGICWTDSKSALLRACKDGAAKHYALKIQFNRETIKNRGWQCRWIQSKHNPSDCCTKVHPFRELKRQLQQIGFQLERVDGKYDDKNRSEKQSHNTISQIREGIYRSVWGDEDETSLLNDADDRIVHEDIRRTIMRYIVLHLMEDLPSDAGEMEKLKKKWRRGSGKKKQ